MQRYLRPLRMLGAILALLCFGATASTAAPSNELVNGYHYPRVVRLSHGSAAVNGTLVASTNGVIFRSVDEGATWKRISVVPSPTQDAFRCCSTLYEMPQAVGSLQAGTLLSAATVRANGAFEIDLYKSVDQGRTWTSLGIPVVGGATGGGGKQGVWEPEFAVGRGGALILFWSDETDPCCSQKLAQMRTFDGVTWQDRKNTVASRVRLDRPGMVTVSKLPNGHYFMSYEMCGPSKGCAASYRVSPDGWNYGDPAWLGSVATTTKGQYFVHAPTNAWSPLPGSANGAVLMVGQTFRESDGSFSSLNGNVILSNRSADGAGPWSITTAPVPVLRARGDQPCTNYSSALLPSRNGAKLLELASDGTRNECSTYFGTASVVMGR